MRFFSLFLPTGIGTIGAIGLGFFFFYRDRMATIPIRQLFIAILLIGFICRVVFSIFTPTFYAPDEQSHFKYVKYLAENGSFPVQTCRTDEPTNDWEYYQPPLYYLSAVPFYFLSHCLSLQEAIAVRVIRSFSVLLWGITILFTCKVIERMSVDDYFITLFMMCMLSLLPTYAFLSSTINNDNLLITIGSIILYLSVQQKQSLRNSIFIGLLLGLALLTKLTAVVYIALIVIMWLIRFITKRYTWSAIHHFVLTMMLALIIWTPWAWRNWSVYGSITAEKIANVEHYRDSTFQIGLDAMYDIQGSFWAVSGIKNNVHFFYPIIGMFVTSFAIAGWLYGLIAKKEKLVVFVGKNPNTLFVWALAVIINLSLAIRFGMLYNQWQGRFLFPLLTPISLLLAIGFRIFPVSDLKSSRIYLVGFFVVCIVSFTLYSLAMFTRLTIP
jgi:4-amino-4-deoxy-L-arabinose transferase-like glycosyltransferase